MGKISLEKKIGYKNLSKDVKEKTIRSKTKDGLLHFDYVYHCPKCGIMVSNTTKHAPAINRNKSAFLFEESVARGTSEVYFRCKKCHQVYNFQA